MRIRAKIIIAGLALAAALAAGQAPAAKINPPWIAVPTDGEQFNLLGVNDIADLHGDVVDPQLVVFFAGNQFMVTHELMQAFREKYPQYRRIYWQTLPPGIEARQIEKGALIVGALRVALRPDVYTRGRGSIAAMQREKGWFGRMVDYARNRLAIMVAKGNPKGIKGLADLGKPGIRVAMPNPRWEGIARPIEKSYAAAGGEALVREIMDAKVKAGETVLTRMHHRQTPMWIMEGKADAGPTWYTEAYFQAMIGNPIAMVEIPGKFNQSVTYTAAKMKNAPHGRAADDFLDFLVSPEGQAIYRKYGFEPPPGQ